VQDVLDAFKKISAQGKKSALDAGAIDKAFTSIGNTLGALAVGAAVTGLAALVDKTIDTVDAQTKMAQRIGISTQQLQVYELAARKAHVSTEAMNTGLQRSAKFFTELQEGSQQAKDTITGLFGNPNALSGLTDTQKLQAVIDKLAGLPPSFNKAALAQRIFGRGGSELIPILDSISSDKLPALTAQAKELGLVLGVEDVEAFKAANDALDDLKATSTALTTQFTAGLVPAVAQTARIIANIITSSDGGAKQLGEDLGVFLTAFTIGLVKVFNAVDGFVAAISAGLTGLFVLISTRDAAQAKAALIRVFKEQEEAAKARLAAIESALAPKGQPDPAAATGTANITNSAATKDALNAQLAAINNARKIRQAALSQQEADDQKAYAQGLKSLQRYYEDRTNIILNQSQAEIDATDQAIEVLKRAPLGAGETQAARQKAIDDEHAKATLAEIDGQKQLSKLAADQAADETALSQKLLDFESKLGALQGDRHEKELAALQKEANQFSILLKQAGAPDQQEQVDNFLNVGKAKIQFDDLKQAGDVALNDIAAKQADLSNQVANGTLFQSQADQQLLNFERQRLFTLTEIANQATVAAQASGDPERIENARRLAQEVSNLATATNRAAQSTAALKTGIENAVGSSLQQFLAQGITQADSLGDAFRGLALSVLQSMQQVIASLIAAQIQAKLFGDLLDKHKEGGGGGGGGGFFGFLGGLFGIGGKAEGGLVTGPGTATSDSIPTRLSNREFVVKAAAVKQPGILPMLEAINNLGARVMQSPKGYFASGGVVTGKDTTASANNLSESGAFIQLGLDPALVVEKFKGSPSFARLVITTANDHRKAMNGALGK